MTHLSEAVKPVSVSQILKNTDDVNKMLESVLLSMPLKGLTMRFDADSGGQSALR